MLPLQASDLARIQLKRAEPVRKSKCIKNNAGLVGENLGFQNIHSPRREHPDDSREKCRTVEHQQHQIEVTVAPKYLDLRFASFQAFIRVVMRADLARRVCQQIAFAEACKKLTQIRWI